MNEARREWAIGAVAVVLALLGLGMEVTTSEVRSEPVAPVAGPRFVERSLFCPPTPREATAGTEIAISAASADEPVGVTIEPAGEPSEEIEPQSALTRTLSKRDPVTITGYGSALQASEMTAMTDPVGGATAALCSPVASKNWFFPEGSSLLGFDERILIYNPFPEEAVVRVLFFTPQGQVSKANLADVPVPAGQSTSVRVNEFILRERIIGAQVTAVRGRVVAWRTVIAKPEDRPHGSYSTLGAIEPAPTVYLPDGAVEELVEERIAVLNPTSEEARITISLLAGDRLIQPRKLSEITLKPRAAQSFSLRDSLPERDSDAGPVSAVVQTTNGVDIFAEATLWYYGSEVNGVSSEIGTPTSAAVITLGPPTSSSAADVVLVVNPSAESVSVTLELWRSSGSAIVPDELANIEVPGGLRRKIPIAKFTEGRPYVVIVRADGPIYAARSAYSSRVGDVASILGVPAQ